MSTDTDRTLAKLESKLARQNAALKETLDEIKTVEAVTTSDPSIQIALQQTLAQLRVKRLRQYNAVLATQGYHAALTQLTTATKKNK